MGTGSGKGLNFGGTAGSLPETVAEEDWHIGRSLSAAAKNYDVKDSNGDVYHFIEGTKLRNVETFAGKGVRKKLKPETLEGLCKEHGGRKRDWKHVKGTGFLDFKGRSREAEVHWFENGSNKVKFKVKKWLER